MENVVPINGGGNREPLEGDRSKGKRHRGKPQPEFSVETPRMPTVLSAAAKREWKRLVPELERAGIIAKVDRALLISWCESVATLEAASKDLAERGLMVSSAREGQPVKNPSAAMQRDAIASLRALAPMLGINPGKRTPNRKSEPSDSDPLAEWR